MTEPVATPTTLEAIDQALAEIRSTYTELPLEKIAPLPATAVSASERWLLASMYAGHEVRRIVLSKPQFSVPTHARLYRTLVVSRMIRPEGQLTSTDLDGSSEDELAVLRAAVKIWPGDKNSLPVHIETCGGKIA